ncbi:hypothetical protein B0H17DRAFT_958584 [Mycena rosella]|uniref:Uncharacterized protein n=1 Tax=Mycena rosella TaxID=1033263 RepID=A0AAD7FXU2_MYCRO|nr:hypothetical protein B0H17DRAFT_958584 [Mycena rosella]
MVAPAFQIYGAAQPRKSLLQLKPSPLRPHCPTDQHIFLWRGIHNPPASAIDHPLIRYIHGLASRSSLKDTASYGSGIRKFHLFCDIFTIPESLWLPAPFKVLHLFALWATTEPDFVDLEICAAAVFEPVSVDTVRSYLSAVRAWHIAQGWLPPLSDEQLDQIHWSLCGLQHMQGSSCKHPIRPPITIEMLHALRAILNLSDPFDTCIWAMTLCAFWGMMRFGEVSVKTRSTFNGGKHLKRRDAFFDFDRNNKPYAHLDLPDAKTAQRGEIQHVFLVAQEGLCPLEALDNLKRVVPAGPDDPLFSWRDNQGNIRPMVKSAAID